MPVGQRELMLDMRRLRGVGNFARVAEYFKNSQTLLLRVGR